MKTHTVNYRDLLLLLLIVAVSCIASPAYATSSPMGNNMCALISMILGSFGRGLATLGIISVGVGALFGKVNWTIAIVVAVGIAVLFGAPDIAFYLSGWALPAGCVNFNAYGSYP